MTAERVAGARPAGAATLEARAADAGADRLPVARRNLWPLGILAAFAAFLAGTVGLIVLSVTHRSDLVAPDYYEQELKYQSQIDRRERTRAWQGLVEVGYDPATHSIVLALPRAHAGRHPSGHVQLYRPSKASLDRRVELAVDAAGRQRLEVGGLASGLWRVRVVWRVGHEEFAFECEVVIGAGTKG